MKKIYNSSGIEVKRPIMGVCPTCGFWKCSGYQHCLRCGQPLRFNSIEWDIEHYVEQYKNLEEEIAALDGICIEERKRLGIDENTPSLAERRSQILSGVNVTEFDVEALHQGNLVKILPNGQHRLIYEGINLNEYDVK